jgi:hypothetical protein
MARNSTTGLPRPLILNEFARLGAGDKFAEMCFGLRKVDLGHGIS